MQIFVTFNFFCFRGFGFITFGDPASVDKVLAQGTHELDGKKVRTASVSICSYISISIEIFATTVFPSLI